MEHQPTFFDAPARPRKRIAATCRADGQKQATHHAGDLRRRLWRLYLKGGWTDDEAADLLSEEVGRKVERTTVIPRRKELGDAIRALGTRINPKSNTANTVWGIS